jgi:hypothetical protein
MMLSSPMGRFHLPYYPWKLYDFLSSEVRCELRRKIQCHLSLFANGPKLSPNDEKGQMALEILRMVRKSNKWHWRFCRSVFENSRRPFSKSPKLFVTFRQRFECFRGPMVHPVFNRWWRALAHRSAGSFGMTEHSLESARSSQGQSGVFFTVPNPRLRVL